MKVLHVAETIWGGCGTYLNELVPLQIESFGIDNVLVIAPDAHIAMLTSVPREAIRTFRRPGRGLGLASLLPRIVATIRAFRPDVIHAHSTFAGSATRFLSLLLPRMPHIVYCPHGWVFDTAKGPLSRTLMRTAERLQAPRCAAIVAVSSAEKAAGEAAGIAPDKLVLIPNGLRTSVRHEQSASWDDHRIKAVFVGRLDRQKGVDVLLKAVLHLQDSVCVRIVGASVVGFGAQPESTRNVEYLGWLNQEAVAAQINACDLVVMPSRWEGCPLVAIEAMRCGKPVVASAVGGLTEMVLDGVTGRLVPMDDPVALAAALTAQSRDTLTAMGRAGRERFLSSYSIDTVHSRVMDLYQKVRGPVSERAPSVS